MADFRLERADERAAINDVVDAAFEDTLTSRLLEALRSSSAWRSLSFVATVDERVVGHLALTRGWLDAQPRLVEVLVLSPMSVHPNFQRHGIGSGLIRFALERARSRPEPLVFLEGDPAFYGRLGFSPGGPTGFVRATVRTPEEAFQYVALPAYEHWMTGQLVYPDPFWEFDCAGPRD